MTVAALVLAITIALLTVHNLGIERLPAALYVPTCLPTTAGLVALAGWGAVGPDEIGLSSAGAGAGSAAGAAVAALVVVAGLLPVTRPLFADRRMAAVGRVGVAYRVLVRIPLGTVVLEEVAFRGVLPALVGQLVAPWWAVAGSCVLFGLWHVVPTVATLRTNHLPARPCVLGAVVVATGLVGAGFWWLRHLTGGLAAPALVHLATSGTATVIGARANRFRDGADSRSRLDTAAT